MSTTTNAIMFSMACAVTEVVAGPAAAQATAAKLTNKLTRCTKSPGANGSFILPSILSGEASEPMMLVNDTGGVVNVYPASGEKINGAAANSPITFGGGTSYILYPVLNSPAVYPSTLDWRGANIS